MEARRPLNLCGLCFCTNKHRHTLLPQGGFWTEYSFSCLWDISEHQVWASRDGQWYQYASKCMFPSPHLFVFASQHLLSSLPPRFTGDRLFFSSNNSVFKKSDLLFSPPDSARFELLMSRFSLPPGSFGNSWPQSGPISMHEALHPKLVSLEQLSALEGFVNSACGGFTTPDDVNQASVS